MQLKAEDANGQPVNLKVPLPVASTVLIADAWDSQDRVTHDRRWPSREAYLADPDGGHGWTTTWDGDRFVSELPDE